MREAPYMDPSFWRERWEQNRIGFHRSDVNPLLVKYWDTLGVPARAHVLVPLCGKSRDLWWLRSEGHRVTGVELSPIAVGSFFEEEGLIPERRSEGAFQVYATRDLAIYCGDFFDISLKQAPPADAVYDRAALIALPAELRSRYAEHLTSLVTDRATLLLVGLEYVTGAMQGPPFSVPETEVRALFGAAFDVELLEESAPEPTRPDFAARGVQEIRETVYRLRRRP